ncbi:MAG: DNA gyrase/topoisomerase IV subunit A [Bacillota bacterium]
MSDEIIPVSIEEKMEQSYLNYSLSVIIGRALPDVRDGLKPVHRRILFGSYGLGLTANKPHKKSARIIGEVLGKYHPHGDNALYNAMVRLAQPFNQRYPLIDGHGNYGSIDGDSAAAMRYTEARLSEISNELLKDLKNNTVQYKDNFDNTLQEPKVLPAAFPQLLVNGSSGIAVGMSTDIPPHNLGEVIDATVALIKNSNLEIDKLINYIPGPDFPTGGEIIGADSIKDAYATGSSSLKVRGKIQVEKNSRQKALIISEIPYQVNKTKLISEITDQIEKDKIENITNVRDESDQNGIRIVLEIKNGADEEIIKNRLYKYTSLLTNIRVNMLALLDNKPLVMNLKDIITNFIEFRKKVVKTRIENLLSDDQNELELLEGLKIALEFLEKVIKIIRGSETKTEAIEQLIKKLKINEKQAKAIMEMQLQRLVRMQQNELNDKYTKTEARIQEYKNILNDQTKLNQLIIKELKEIKNKYNDERKTKIIANEAEATIDKSDLIKEKELIISLSAQNLIKKTDSRDNIRSAKNDWIIKLFNLMSFDNILFFTNDGDVHSLAAHDISEHHGLSTGEPLNKYFSLPPEKKLVDIIPLNDKVKDESIILATKNGKVKATSGSEYISSVSKIKAINLEDDDEIISAFSGTLEDDLLLGTHTGKFIRFSSSEISNTGRNTKGYNGIKLNKSDYVLFANLIKDKTDLLMTSKDNRIARVNLSSIKTQNRYGKGKQVMHSKYYINQATTCYKDSTLLFEDHHGNKEILSISNLSRFSVIPVNRTDNWPFEKIKNVAKIDIIIES